MTNGDRIRNCTNKQLESVYFKLKEWCAYADGRLLCFNDNPEDFLLWINKESDELDDIFFD